jgi:hypothetical protein
MQLIQPFLLFADVLRDIVVGNAVTPVVDARNLDI